MTCDYRERPWSFAARQATGMACLLAAAVLSLPAVPGPGFVFFGAALVLLEYPRKARLVAAARRTRRFRLFRVWLRRRWGLLLVG